jgi:hypothetical protein
MSFTDLVVDQDHQHYLDAAAAKSRVVGVDAAPSALDPTLLAAVDVVRAFPATAHLAWDVQNSLAQRVVDALEGWLLDDPGEEEPQLKALAEARRKIQMLETKLTKARKAAAKSGGAA